MMKTLATITALGALAIAPAIAQTNPQNMTKPSEPPVAQAPAAPSAAPKSVTPAQSLPSAPSTASTPSMTSMPTIVAEQKPDQWLASTFEGTDVIGPENKKVGDVSDILFEQDGSIKAFVVEVGGFLGIGAKNVAIAPSSFQVVSGDKPGDKKLKLSMTADELKQAATFKPHKAEAARQTTGTSPAAPMRGN